MSQIVLYFLHLTSALSFHIEVVLALSITLIVLSDKCDSAIYLHEQKYWSVRRHVTSDESMVILPIEVLHDACPE